MSVDSNLRLNKVADCPNDLLKDLNDLVVWYSTDESYSNWLNLIGKKKSKHNNKFNILAGWKILSNGILDDYSAEKSIFMQEIQKRRKLKAKVNILKQSSLRSLGRRAGWLKVNHDSPVDINELFEQAKSNYVKRKLDPFVKDSYTKAILSENEFDTYTFSQAGSYNTKKSVINIKNKKLRELHYDTVKLKEEGIELKNVFSQKSKDFKRFMKGINLKKRKRNTTKSKYLDKHQESCNVTQNKPSNTLKSANSNVSCITLKDKKEKHKPRIYKTSKNVCSSLINSQERIYRKPENNIRPNLSYFINKTQPKAIKKIKAKMLKKLEFNHRIKDLLIM